MEIRKRTLIWIAIGALFVFALYLTFKGGATGNVVSAAQSAAPAVKTVASSGMVGGC